MDSSFLCMSSCPPPAEHPGVVSSDERFYPRLSFFYMEQEENEKGSESDEEIIDVLDSASESDADCPPSSSSYDPRYHSDYSPSYMAFWVSIFFVTNYLSLSIYNYVIVVIADVSVPE